MRTGRRRRPPARSRAAAARDPDRLRIGFTLTSALAEAPLDPVCAAAVPDAAALLESLGHTIEELQAPWAGIELLPDFSRLFGPNVSMTTLTGAKLRGREPAEEDVEPLTWVLLELAREQSATRPPHRPGPG